MAAFTINSGAVVNWDTLTGGSTNATLDTYNISNGSTLKINTDTFQCTNHSTAFGSVDTVSFSGAGGTLQVDGRDVKVFAYNNGSGNVAAPGTTVNQIATGASATLLGVWANWQSEPVATGNAMPATGFVKVKNVSGTFDNMVTTGIVCTPTEALRPGWIEIRGADTATVTVPRIGKFEVLGDWFDLGTTNGTRGQVLACPTTATVAGVFPAVWIETSAGSGVYEIYHSVGSLAAASTIPTDAVRAKMFWQTTSGIRIGSDGTNNVGFLPASGCKVRIPNVIFTCCTRTVSGSGARVLPNATLATRQEFVTTSAGDIQIDKAVLNWYCNFVQAYNCAILNSAINDTLVYQEIASACNVQNICVAPTQLQINTPLNQVSCFAGGNFTNNKFIRISLAASGNYCNTITSCTGITYTRCTFKTLTNRANATTGTMNVAFLNNCTFTDSTLIGGRGLVSTSLNSTFTNTVYADNFTGTTGTTNPCSVYEVINGCNTITVEGITFGGLSLQQSYNALVGVTNSANVKIRNIGSFVSPLDLGATNGSGVVLISGGNNDNIKVQRVYVTNTRTGLKSLVNSDNNIMFETVFGDFADATAIPSLNTVVKHTKQTSTTAGQVSVYGTHWYDSFTSATVGKIVILCNEPTISSASQCFISSGTPKFNSSGSVALTVVGQQVTWEMPYFAKGMTALANLAITLTGTNTGNLTYEFQYDKGSGYNGTWLTLNATNLNSAGAITPSTGVRLKVRVTCATASASNLLTNISIPTVTTSTDQNQTYPLDLLTLSLTGLQTLSDVFILQAGTSTVLYSVNENASTTFNYQYETSQTVDIGVIKPGYKPLYIRNYPLSSSQSVSLPVSQENDRVYQS